MACVVEGGAEAGLLGKTAPLEGVLSELGILSLLERVGAETEELWGNELEDPSIFPTLMLGNKLDSCSGRTGEG